MVSDSDLTFEAKHFAELHCEQAEKRFGLKSAKAVCEGGVLWEVVDLFVLMS